MWRTRESRLVNRIDTCFGANGLLSQGDQVHLPSTGSFPFNVGRTLNISAFLISTLNCLDSTFYETFLGPKARACDDIVMTLVEIRYDFSFKIESHLTMPSCSKSLHRISLASSIKTQLLTWPVWLEGAKERDLRARIPIFLRVMSVENRSLIFSSLHFYQLNMEKSYPVWKRLRL